MGEVFGDFRWVALRGAVIIAVAQTGTTRFSSPKGVSVMKAGLLLPPISSSR